MIGGRLALLLLALSLAGSATAGTLYRCEGTGGTTYSGTRLAGMRCTAMSTYRSSPGTKATEQAPVSVTPVVATTTPPPAPSPSAEIQPPAAIPTISATGSASPGRGERHVSGAVYSYMKDGVRYVTSKPPRGMAIADVRTIRYSFIERCFACDPTSHINFRTLSLNTSAYQQEITAAAKLYGVEEAVVRAIIHAESAYNPRALSRAGAQGLMQLMPATARRFGVSDTFNAAQNIQGGVQYLAWLAKRYGGDITRIAAGYNAGEGAVDKYGGVPPYSETRAYVERVRTLADRYRARSSAN
ncbi:lytic transglycosylase domain-containing protein [Solilutibacter silvestris]|uniref:Transglycosylase SLT domain n=1 Tax=Solilutibacter silvestris TaxID=1645665 RepID=A0A2K1Q335_9GAMM|nr:lytic transglycosylase domain-containing protein [Lysobacter silvestris]PNS09444.1 Transglycosylase SLT domain [Lysobacter silvestris]